jgi:hypothetical protein
MTRRQYLLVGALLAPIAGVATGIWAEFADLSPPVLLVVTVPAIVVSVLCVSRLTERTHPLALASIGAVIGLLTFAISAGVYIAIHYVSSGGFDVNDDESGGSALVFFLVHIGVGTVVGLVIGAFVALVAYVMGGRDRGRYDQNSSKAY